MRGHDIPQIAEQNTLTTYEALHDKFDDFLTGKMKGNMLLVARPGIGKSFYTKANANRKITAILEGNLRPLKTYMSLYAHRNKLIVLDDAETLWADKSGRIILRELTDTTFPKTISWNSTVKQLEKSGTPMSYETNSRALIICNTFRFGRSDETDAIIDRCQCYHFDPTNEQVATYAADWFWNQTVFNFVLRNLHRIDKLSARMLVRAAERQQLGDKKWKNELPILHGVEAIIQDVCTNAKWRTKQKKEMFVEVERRVLAYCAAHDLEPGRDIATSQASFYRIAAQMEKRGQLRKTPPRLKLDANGVEPEVPTGVDEILADVMRAEEERAALMEEMDIDDGSDCAFA